MPIDVACVCGKRFRVKDEHAGKKGKCPACGQAVVIPMPAREPPEEQMESVVAEPEVRQKACPNCGAVISYFARVCPECRANLKSGSAKGGAPRRVSGFIPKAEAARAIRATTSAGNSTPGSPPLGIALGLGIGLASAFAAAWAYAYVDLIFPIWSILITIAFGAALGYVPSLSMVAGGLRDRRIGFPIVAVVVCFGYWLTWAVWVHAVFKTDAPAVSELMSNPSKLTSLIGEIRDIGVWRYSGGAEPVHGSVLTIVWLVEAILILGTALTAAWVTLEDDVPG